MTAPVLTFGAAAALAALTALAWPPAAWAPAPRAALLPVEVRGVPRPMRLDQLHLTMRGRESFPQALARAGVPGPEAASVARAAADVFDTVNPRPGTNLDVSLRPGASEDRAPRLMAVRLRTSLGRQVEILRGDDGTLSTRSGDDAVVTNFTRVSGAVHGSLYLSLVSAGLDVGEAALAVRATGAHLDLAREVGSGDRFRLAFSQVAGSPAPRRLDYIEIDTSQGSTRLYRWGGGDGDDFVDGALPLGVVTLLRTPVDGARITSGFGLRLHPILGFTRLHQGVDFGAAPGTPVLAAADGVVEEARWAGGYGRWLRIRHAAALETGYGHLQAWAAGMNPGARVRRGQVVGYVGASGLATGPHLHYEVFEGGVRVDPRTAAAIRLPGGAAGADPAFRAARERMDAAVAALDSDCSGAQARATCRG